MRSGGGSEAEMTRRYQVCWNRLSCRVCNAENLNGSLMVVRVKSKTSQERHSMQNHTIIVTEESCRLGPREMLVE